VHRPSSAITMAGGALRPVMLVSATPFTTPGATYATALDLQPDGPRASGPAPGHSRCCWPGWGRLRPT
jgi:hypothetical protein